MYVSSLKLWNFRKYGSDTFDLDSPHLSITFNERLNVLIGENDSGKSAIIDAIKLVLRTHSFEPLFPGADDFFEDSPRFRIELRIDGFADDCEEGKYFTECLSWEGEGDDTRFFLVLALDVTRNKERILPSDVRAGLTESGQALSADARDILKVTYLKPLRDASNELISRRGSRLSRILYGHEAFKSRDDDHYLIGLLNDFSGAVENYFRGQRLVENGEGEKILENIEDDQLGKELKDRIDEYIRAFCDDQKASDLQAFTGDLKNILERLELVIKDEKNLGLGTLNRLSMASELLHLSRRTHRGLRVGLIEELEAHLHPQAQMQVIEFLQKDDNRQSPPQLILTTHSPNLASKVKLENLILCHGHQIFPMKAGATKLQPTDYVFLEKFLDVTKANLFFAKGVILVEGWSEEILMPSLARRLGFDLTRSGVSVINVASLAFTNYSRIFLRNDEPHLPVPVAIITDLDVPVFERTDAGILRRDEVTVGNEKEGKLETKLLKYNDQSVRAFIAPEWTFEFSLFQSEAFGGLFKESVKEAHPNIELDNFEAELVSKLLSKSLNKTKISYCFADRLDRFVGPLVTREGDFILYLRDAIQHACNNG